MDLFLAMVYTVCMYACMHAWMYVCIYTATPMCIYIYAYTYIYIYIYTHTRHQSLVFTCTLDFAKLRQRRPSHAERKPAGHSDLRRRVERFMFETDET